MLVTVLQFPGTNCEYDTKYAFEKLGAEVKIVWYKDTNIDPNTKLVVIPGGFSYGDYLRSGALAKLAPIMKSIKEYANNGGNVLGICNGFQILTETRLLPGALKRNDNLHFISKYHHLKVVNNDNDFLQKLDVDEVLNIPIAHHDGNYFIDETGLKELEQNNQILLRYTGKDGNIKRAYITLKDNEWTDGSGNKHFSTFTTIADDGTETIYDIYDNEGNKTPIHDKTTITQELDPETCKLCNITHTTKGITYKQLNDVIGMLVSDNLPQDSNGDGKYDFTEYKNGKDSSKELVNVAMENGKIFIEDKQNATTKIKFAINDRDSDSYDGSSPVFKFNSNNAITIDEPKVDIFHQLDEIIESVENGKVRVDGNSENPRERGIQEGIELIDHLQDHIIKKHTEIGAISKSLQNTEERNNMLIVHVETLKSSVIDVDMAEASLKLQKLTLNYNAMLSTISKVNGLSLVNYMK